MKFDGDFIKTLERLSFLAKRIQKGMERGERIGAHRGESLEFADYRAYSPGDEIRSIDWNVYARHDHLFIREFAAMKTMHLAVLVDSSASMDFPSSSSGVVPTKFGAARTLCAALAYIGLSRFDTTSVLHFRDTLMPVRTFMKGRRMIFDLLRDLDQIRPEGRTQMAGAFRTPVPRLKGASVVVVLSDFYDFEGAQETLSRLRLQHDRVHLVHVRSEEEDHPPAGRFIMTDPETGRELDMAVTRRAADRYREALQKHNRDLQDFCKKSELYYVAGSHTEPLEEWIIRLVTAGGIMKRG